MQFFQTYVLHQWLILAALGVVFIVISRWALVSLREYAGYGLGWMLGLFFVIVYGSIGGGRGYVNTEPQYLDIFQVVIATFFGLVFGAIIQLGMRFGMKIAQGVALQVALYTALGIIVIFLVAMEGTIAQRMIGIFSLAVGISTLFAMVLLPTSKHEREIEAAAYRQPIAPVPNNPVAQIPPQNLGQGGGGTRLDEIRQRLNQDGRR